MIVKNIGLTVTVDRVDEITKTIRALTKQRVLVGIPAENAARDPQDGDEINNAQIGYINEFGVPEKNIPPRPHLVPGVEATLPDVIKRFKKAAVDGLDGNVKAVDTQMNAVGLNAVSSVRQVITDTLSPPLSPKTIYNRQHRNDLPKRTGTQPLIDFGDYIKHINYVIRKVR
jgi:hypothetical protein